MSEIENKIITKQGTTAQIEDISSIGVSGSYLTIEVCPEKKIVIPYRKLKEFIYHFESLE